jgi:hypothetical protein
MAMFLSCSHAYIEFPSRFGKRIDQLFAEPFGVLEETPAYLRYREAGWRCARHQANENV